MILSALSIIQNFQYFNYIFDAFIVLITLGYFICGFKRGFARSLWVLFFDIISIVAILVVWNFVFPLFIGKIPVFGVGIFKKAGIAFFYTAFYRFIIKFIISIILFFIIRFKIFKSILTRMHEYSLDHPKKKRFIGRVFSSICTAGIALILSSGCISLTNEYTKGQLFKNYDTEVKETYAAKYALKFFDRLVEKMVDSDSIINPHQAMVKVLTEDKYTLEDIPNYRGAIYRAMVASSPESYLNLVEADTNSGLIKFSQDLKAWAMYSSLDNYDAAFETLDKLIAPILDKAIENGYVYTGDTTKFAQEISDCSVFVTSRFHGAVVAAAYGIETVCVSDREKLTRLSEEIGLHCEKKSELTEKSVLSLVEKARVAKIDGYSQKAEGHMKVTVEFINSVRK